MSESITIFPLESNERMLDSAMMIEYDTKFKAFFSGSLLYFATLSGGMEIVLKISSYEDGARREWKGLNKAQDAGIPTSKPLALVKTETDEMGIISQRVHGESLNKKSDNKIKIMLGKTIRNMHLNAIIEGKEWEISNKAVFVYYKRYFDYWVKLSIVELSEESIALTLLSELSISMESYLLNIAPVFVHNDLHDAQVIIRDNGSIAVIDFENWKEENPLHDVAFYVYHCIRMDKSLDGITSFITGYFSKLEFDEQVKLALSFYLLFISSRAIGFFYSKKDKRWYQRALEAHSKVVDFVVGEQIWKHKI